MSDDKKWAYLQEHGDWSVRGSYQEPDNIEFLYQGAVFRRVTCPGYKIWNIAAHLPDYIHDLESARAAAATFGCDFTKWLICKRREVWAVIPPRGYVVQRGGEFASGAEALAAFASGGHA